MTKVVIKLIEFYQAYLSFDTGVLRIFAPGGACRYPIRCSEYTKEAIMKYGVIKGSLLGLRRIMSCNPFN